ncbi:MAG: hypothetical protein RBG13Loki_3774 [Promethearchaeota archaeon CR_4]|nr:MAG: hypothetical protein RBG13Loki_3774 [Candidatus Lokiarchaeota archaeon CR_4]
MSFPLFGEELGKHLEYTVAEVSPYRGIFDVGDADFLSQRRFLLCRNLVVRVSGVIPHQDDFKVGVTAAPRCLVDLLFHEYYKRERRPNRDWLTFDFRL